MVKSDRNWSGLQQGTVDVYIFFSLDAGSVASGILVPGVAAEPVGQCRILKQDVHGRNQGPGTPGAYHQPGHTMPVHPAGSSPQFRGYQRPAEIQSFQQNLTKSFRRGHGREYNHAALPDQPQQIPVGLKSQQMDMVKGFVPDPPGQMVI
jgi:hypothetical protein